MGEGGGCSALATREIRASQRLWGYRGEWKMFIFFS